MATHRSGVSFALRPVSDRDDQGAPRGAWWPETRDLTDQLPALFALWPAEAGRIVRVLYSPPDWDDRPRSVQVSDGRRVKTGSFPRDDTHRLTLSMMNGKRYAITVIAPDTSAAAAADVLSTFAAETTARP
jgi:hypothetical protein